jgi:beta-lactamase class D
MGFDAGILIDETTPEWEFKDEYQALLPCMFDMWKSPYNPTLWIKNSSVWYSQLITQNLGMRKFKDYVEKFEYGNKDLSGTIDRPNGLTQAWLSSSLQISANEQIAVLEKLLDEKFPVTKKAHDITKTILFSQDLENDWKLYGKTGTGNMLNKDGTRNNNHQIGWYIGWVTNDKRTIIFAHCIEDASGKDIAMGKIAREIVCEKLAGLMKVK